MPKKKTKKGQVSLSQFRHLINVPIVNQATDYTCGVAALLSVLYYWDKGEDIYESELAGELKANEEDGVISAEMARYAWSMGFNVEPRKRMTLKELEGHIRAGRPVIVLLQAWRDSKKTPWSKWDDGHFAVAIGFDADNICFMDPSTLGNYTYIPKKEFLRRWHDWDGEEKVHRLGVVVSRERSTFDARVAIKME